jgi:flagellar hook-associated protein FlgK
MIEQYLPNNNEKSYSTILQNFFASKPALDDRTKQLPISAVPVQTLNGPVRLC